MIYAETERLVLRRPREEDLEAMLPSWSDPDMTRFTPDKPNARQFLIDLIADVNAKEPGETSALGPWFQYVIERRSDGALLGDLGVGFGVPGERQVELGYRILPEHQGQGFAREAVAAMIDHLIAAHGVHRFIGVVAAGHHASIRLLRSLGFCQEGHFRQSFWCNGEWLDDEYFALLASEWREGRGR